jgi:carboxyl-terminal processing protease
MESGERYLDDALSWDEIDEVQYRPWHMSPLPLSLLKSKSEARVKASEVFQAIAERGEDLEESYNDTMVTLSFDAMMKEREENEKQAEHHQELMDKLKEKIDPVTFAEDQKKKEEEERLAASGNTNKKPNADKTPEEIKAEQLADWQKGVKFDPYVRESMHILDDLITHRQSTALKN